MLQTNFFSMHWMLTRKENTMKTPSTNLLELLISLYADQEGIKIDYELEDK